MILLISAGKPVWLQTPKLPGVLIDRQEGNDFNLNGLADDNVTVTGFDTDGDGLDNRFDSLNSVTNIKGTSYRMGNGGTFTGDAAPGSKTTVQRTLMSQPDRDWRYSGYIFIADREIDRFEIERSIKNIIFTKVNMISTNIALHTAQSFTETDDILVIKAKLSITA